MKTKSSLIIEGLSRVDESAKSLGNYVNIVKGQLNSIGFDIVVVYDKGTVYGVKDGILSKGEDKYLKKNTAAFYIFTKGTDYSDRDNVLVSWFADKKYNGEERIGKMYVSNLFGNKIEDIRVDWYKNGGFAGTKSVKDYVDYLEGILAETENLKDYIKNVKKLDKIVDDISKNISIFLDFDEVEEVAKKGHKSFVFKDHLNV